MKKGAVSWGRGLLTALFPYKCLACGALLPWEQNREPGEGETEGTNSGAEKTEITARFGTEMAPYLCRICNEAFQPVADPICTRCGVPFRGRGGRSRLCEKCLEKSDHPLGKIRSVGLYTAVLADLVQAFKFNHKVQLASPFGRLLHSLVSRYWNSGDIDVVIPVPLFPARMRKRGYNQSWLMVREWPETGGDVCRFDVAPDLMIRHRQTLPQVRLSHDQRQDNIRGAFKVTAPKNVAARNILLVDDVYTTGATLNECAQTLLAAGARRVDALTLARAL